MHNSITRNIPIISILLIAIVFRLILAYFHPTIVLSADSYEYDAYASNIHNYPSLKLFIQPYRTPIYPLFILFSRYISGMIHVPPMNVLMFLQSCMGIAGILLFYRLCLRLEIHRKLALIVTLLFATNMLFIAWERVLLTEALAIFYVLLFASIFVEQALKPKPVFIMLLAGMSFVGFYLRPALILFSGMSFVVLFLYQRKFSVRKWICIAILFVVLFLGFHRYINLNKWAYNGLIMISDTNLFGKILEYNLPIESGKQYSFFYNNLTHYRENNGTPNPYRFYDVHDPDISVHMDRLAQMRMFTLAVISHNLQTFIFRSIFFIPWALSDVSVLIRPMLPKGLVEIYQGIQSMILLAIPFLLFKARKTAISLLGVISFAYVFAMVMFGYEDWGRLIVEVMPLILLFTVYLGKDLLMGSFRRCGGAPRIRIGHGE